MLEMFEGFYVRHMSVLPTGDSSQKDQFGESNKKSHWDVKLTDS